MNSLEFPTNLPGKQTRIIDSRSSSHILLCKDLFDEIKNAEKN